MYKKQTKMLLQPKLDHNTRQMGTFPHIYHYHYSHTFLCIGFLNVCQVCAKVFTGLSQTFSILNIRRRRRGRQNGILGFKSTVRTGFTRPVDGLWVHTVDTKGRRVISGRKTFLETLSQQDEQHQHAGDIL